MVSLKDIAEITGVSISTVSRVLSNKGKIGEETRKKVLSAAQELKFKKGIVSQSIETASLSIGMVVPTRGEYYHDDPASSADVRSIRDCFEQAGHSIKMISLPAEKEAQKSLSASLKNSHYEGLIISDPPVDGYFVALMKKTEIPFILVNGIFREQNLNQVDYDNYSGMKELVSSLPDKLLTKAVVIAGPENRSVNKNRMDGLLDAFAEKGIPECPVIYGDFSLESGYSHASKYLKENDSPKIFICFSDYIALGAIRACKEAGIRIPQDICITGFDDIEMARFSDPPLTTVKRYSEKFAPYIVHSAVQVINLKNEIASKQTLFKTELIERESVKG